MFYDYDYFCGANVLVEIDNMVVTEVAALSFEINESKIPIYGYSSRHFDGVANGQVLVQGSMMVNFVHHDYLHKLIGIAKGEIASAPPTAPTVAGDEIAQQELLQAISTDPALASKYADMFKSQVWDQGSSTTVPRFVVAHNPHDRMGSVDIKVTFGERTPENGYDGRLNLVLADVYFIGRGMPIQIDENVIVEEYRFFGRDLQYVQNPVVPVVAFSEEDDEVVTEVKQDDINLSEMLLFSSETGGYGKNYLPDSYDPNI